MAVWMLWGRGLGGIPHRGRRVFGGGLANRKRGRDGDGGADWRDRGYLCAYGRRGRDRDSGGH